MKETDHRMNNLTKKMAESEHRWGKFVEALVEGALIKLLKNLCITVERTSSRENAYYNNRQYKIDIIAKTARRSLLLRLKQHCHPEM